MFTNPMRLLWAVLSIVGLFVCLAAVCLAFDLWKIFRRNRDAAEFVKHGKLPDDLPEDK